MKVLLVAVLCLSVQLSLQRRHKHHPHKIHHQPALLERPEPDALVGPTPVDGDDGHPFDWNGLLGNSQEGAHEFKNFFSRVWERLYNRTRHLPNIFGTDDEMEAVEPDEEAFGNGFLNMLKPWWKGANVCTREEEYEESSEDSNSLFNSLLTSCQDIGNVYKCTMKVGKDGKVQVRTLVYQCCHGWDREPGKKGCTKKTELKSITETLEDMNMTMFLQALDDAKMQPQLEEGNFTLFVPDNQAMTTVTDSEEINFVVSESDDRLQFVRDILDNHKVDGWQFSHMFEDEMRLETKDGKNIRINYFSHPRPFMTANCARITSSDNEATNGLIHVVDRVLMPARQNLWEILGQDTRFSIFSSLVPKDLQELLSEPEAHYTVLAFPDVSFEKLPATLQEQIKKGEGCFEDVIREHIIPHTICTDAVHGEAVVRSLAGHLVNATRDVVADGPDAVRFENVPVVWTDRMATNGVVQVIDGVLMLEHMLDAISVANKRKGTVFSGLLASNEALSDSIKSAESVTLFVPPNEALMELPKPENPEETQKMLENHVVDNLVEVSVDNPETIVSTKAGRDLSITVKRTFGQFDSSFDEFFAPVATIGCARILKSNVRACNGVIHFIDRVLKVPTDSLLDLLESKPELSEFVTLLEMSGVDSELANFSGTVLAPTNDALERYLPAEKKEEILADQEKISQFIRQHLLEEQLCCHQFGGTSFFTQNRHRNLAGNELASAQRRVGGAYIESCDQLATNGILQVIDRPIIRRRVSSLADLFERFGQGRSPFDDLDIDFPF